MGSLPPGLPVAQGGASARGGAARRDAHGRDDDTTRLDARAVWLALALTISGPAHALAATYVWTGNSGSAYENLENWRNTGVFDDPGTPQDERWGVPGAADDARFEGTGSWTVLVSDARSCAQLVMVNTTMTVASSGDLTCVDLRPTDSNLIVAGRLNVSRDVPLSAARRSSFEVSGTLSIARQGFFADCTVEVLDGGLLRKPAAAGTGFPDAYGVSFAGASTMRVAIDGRVLIGDPVGAGADDQVQIGARSHLSVGAGSRLEAGGIYLGPSGNFFARLYLDGTVSGSVTSDGNLLFRAGAMVQGGQLRLRSGSRLEASLGPSWDASALWAEQLVLSGGTLAFSRAFGYTDAEWTSFMQVGRRHQLIGTAWRYLDNRFERFTGSVDVTGGSLGTSFLGLDYLVGQTGGIDLLVLEQPRVNYVYPYLPWTAPGLVLLTHGWNSSGGVWPDAAAQEVSQALTRTGQSGDWTVASFDWGPFAATGNTPSAPAQAAHMAHEIGESLALWLREAHGSLTLQHVHAIGHSAGSWLVDGFIDRMKARGPVSAHATFLDAYVPGITVPGESTPAADELGNTADWAEQYYESGLTMGTFTVLNSAVNVDVTDDECSNLSEENCHSVPVVYYRNSVTTLVLPLPEVSCGFGMSREARGSLPSHTDWPQGRRADRDCHLLPPVEAPAALNMTALAPIASPTGTVRLTEDGGAVLTTGSPVSLTLQLETPSELTGIEFDYEFLAATPAHFSVRFDGLVVYEGGGNEFNPFEGARIGSGLLQLSPPPPAGVHSLEFRLEPAGTDPCSTYVGALKAIGNGGTVSVPPSPGAADVRPAIDVQLARILDDGLRVRLTAPGSRATTLELFDIGGRRLARRVTTLRDGEAEEFDLRAPTPLRAGVYLVRATQGATTRTHRFAITR